MENARGGGNRAEGTSRGPQVRVIAHAALVLLREGEGLHGEAFGHHQIQKRSGQSVKKGKRLPKPKRTHRVERITVRKESDLREVGIRTLTCYSKRGVGRVLLGRASDIIMCWAKEEGSPVEDKPRSESTSRGSKGSGSIPVVH